MSAPFSADDRAFLRAILNDPAELTGWLVYADWLDERDDPRAEFIRLELRRTAPDLSTSERSGIVARLKDLRAGLDPDWVAVFDRPRVENCDELFAFKCPKKWEQLKATERSGERFCEACRESVYYCHTIREAYAHARQGHCVAVSRAETRYPNDLRHDPDEHLTTLGIPAEWPAPGDGDVRVVSTSGFLRMPEPPPAPPRRPWWKFW